MQPESAAHVADAGENRVVVSALPVANVQVGGTTASSPLRQLLSHGPLTFAEAYPLLEADGWLNLPLVDCRTSARTAVWVGLKRVADIVMAAFLLLMLLPFMVMVGLLIRLESPGPALFAQERVGRFGKTFRILKFRTMVDGAHRLESTLVAARQGDPRFVKIECDPRATRLGRILRKTSIDELPQLWNVLRGDMSLVGPRPSQPQEVAHYSLHEFPRLLVRPGITGLWQVSGRSALSFEQAVELDRAYVRNWTPFLDFKILLKTVTVVLRCDGAC